MKIGKIITELRSKLNWSQTDLADKSGVSRVMIGKYEREEALPSIDTAKKIADAFEVSLDYLVGEGINSSFDKRMVRRLEEIEEMKADFKTHLLSIVDSVIRDYKTQQAYKNLNT